MHTYVGVGGGVWLICRRTSAAIDQQHRPGSITEREATIELGATRSNDFDESAELNNLPRGRGRHLTHPVAGAVVQGDQVTDSDVGSRDTRGFEHAPIMSCFSWCRARSGISHSGTSWYARSRLMSELGFLGVRHYGQRMTKSSTPGQRARNTNSIKLRTSDGKRGAVQVRKFESALTSEQSEAGPALRAERKRLQEEAAALTMSQTKLRPKKADEKHATDSHTPSEWVPAHMRTDYIDPFAKDRDPRRQKSQLK